MPVVNLYFKKFILVILALQILNLSIYNTNFYVFNCFNSSKEQIKDVNPIDSFAELIVENVGGYNNAFPEPTHKNEKQSGDLQHNITFKLICQDNFASIPDKVAFQPETSGIDCPLFREQYSYLFWKEINHPPA